MLKWLNIPKFDTYEDFLGSSWLSIRIATIIAFLGAYFAKQVVAEFSLYDGWEMHITSFLTTFIFGLAILSFTVKLANVPKEEKEMKTTIRRLIVFFALLELLFQVSYHVIWHNRTHNTTNFEFPPLTLEFGIMMLIDTALPLSLYFYAHTVHIKTKSELRRAEESIGDQEVDDLISIGDKIELQAITGRKSTVRILKRHEKDSSDNNTFVVKPDNPKSSNQDSTEQS